MPEHGHYEEYVGSSEDNNNFISLEPSFATSGSNDQVRVDYT